MNTLSSKMEAIAGIELAQVRRNYAYRLSYHNLNKFLDNEVSWECFNLKDRMYQRVIAKQDSIIAKVKLVTV